MSMETNSSADRAPDLAPDRYALRGDGMFARNGSRFDRTTVAAPAAKPVIGRPGATAEDGPLLDPRVVEQLRGTWRQVQYDFVDDPHAAISRADALVERAAVALADAVNARSAAVRASWQQEDGPGRGAMEPAESTEHLRRVVQQYRAVLERVLGS